MDRDHHHLLRARKNAIICRSPGKSTCKINISRYIIAPAQTRAIRNIDMYSRQNMLTDTLMTGLQPVWRQAVARLWVNSCNVLTSCYKTDFRHYAGIKSVSWAFQTHPEGWKRNRCLPGNTTETPAGIKPPGFRRFWPLEFTTRTGLTSNCNDRLMGQMNMLWLMTNLPLPRPMWEPFSASMPPSPASCAFFLLIRVYSATIIFNNFYCLSNSFIQVSSWWTRYFCFGKSTQNRSAWWRSAFILPCIRLPFEAGACWRPRSFTRPCPRGPLNPLSCGFTWQALRFAGSLTHRVRTAIPWPLTIYFLSLILTHSGIGRQVLLCSTCLTLLLKRMWNNHVLSKYGWFCIF